MLRRRLSVITPNEVFEVYQQELLFGLLALFVLATLVQVLMYRRLSAKFMRYRNLIESAGPGLGDVLAEISRLVEHVDARLDEIASRNAEMERKIKRCVQTPGVVRFNAFDDVGSDLSYAVAALDALGDGVVMSGLFSRNESRTYAKPIREGGSSYNLTDEEQEAIRKVMLDVKGHTVR